jgi:hypothetical protein
MKNNELRIVIEISRKLDQMIVFSRFNHQKIVRGAQNEFLGGETY